MILDSSKDEKAETASKPSTASQPSLMDLFKPKPGTWKCSVCDVSNGPDKNECAACTTPKPGGGGTAAPAPAPAASPAKKKWECPYVSRLFFLTVCLNF